HHPRCGGRAFIAKTPSTANQTRSRPPVNLEDIRPMRRPLPILMLALLCAAAPLAAGAESLPPQVVSALRHHELDGAGLSVFVQDVDATEPLLSFNADTLRSPASVIKVLTSYVALDLLGPAYRWQTEVWVTGPVRDRRLEGDLVLRGGGDPSLTTERLWTMLREIRALGIVEI